MKLPIKLALTISAYLVGLVSLSMLIAWGGPLLAIGSWRPLENDIVRYIVTAVVLAIGSSLGAWLLWRRHKRAQQLETALVESQKAAESDEKVLAGKMKDALVTLKSAAGGDSANYLYDLPWYVIIGPPGSGKTTALINSGLKFPLSRGATPAAVAGSGGTRYCDWWFTEEAVLIDTAGRYTTQDSDPRNDARSWIAFLDLLKSNRPHQPINGVLVAISLEDLLTSKPDELNAHADAIRGRLIELHDRLKVDFPVYVLFTKADLVAGFSEFFDIFNEDMRKQVWGATFQVQDRKRNMVGEVPAEFDALLMRLNELTTDRLQEEPTPSTRVALYAFPAQMARLRRPVHDFLNRIFEPTRYHANAMLRGFYFTSGTQEGTPIDQLIGALARNFGGQEVKAARLSRLGKSYFLANLLSKTIFGEANWVSVDAAAVRRERLLKIAGFASLAALAAGIIFAWSLSYTRNRGLIHAAEASAAAFTQDAKGIIGQTRIAERDMAAVLPLLQKLRSLPTGYDERDVATPTAETFGLSQRERLASTAVNSYHLGLERMFRPRLVYRLEEFLEENRQNPSETYEALKVYLMLTGAPRRDPGLVASWMAQDWGRLYPGAGNAAGREKLGEHLMAMMELDEGRDPSVGPHDSLVSFSQRALARLSVAQRAYALLKSQAGTARAPDWTPQKACGDDFLEIFDGARERTVVPGFFTYAGFRRAVIDRLPGIQERLAQDKWVLGAAGEQSGVEAQYRTLSRDVLDLYSKEFIAAWKGVLGTLQLKSMIADKPKYVPLRIVSAPNSPFKCLFEQLRLETAVTQARQGFEPEDKGKPGTGAVLIGGGSSTPAAPAAQADASGTAPGANIEAEFRPFYRLVEGDRRQIDEIITALARVYDTAMQATNPMQASLANASLPALLETLRGQATRLPAPFNAMLQTVADQFDSDATSVALAQLRRKLGDEVTGRCTELVNNTYPFQDTSREIALRDFGRLFGTGGILDQFFTANLAAYVDKSRPEWAWRTDTRIGKALSAFPDTLRHFQTASRLQEIYLAGGTMPSLSLSITPPQLPAAQPGGGGLLGAPPPAAEMTIRLDANGTLVNSSSAPPAPVTVAWPGVAANRSAVIVGDGGTAPPATLERRGVWSLFRLIEAGGGARATSNTFQVNYSMGGRVITYRITASTSQNPFNLALLREFRCPARL